MAQYDNVDALYQDIQNYVDTNESSLVKKIPAWIYLAESELDRRLRHPAAENVQTFKVLQGNDYLTAPIDLLELKSIKNNSTGDFLYRRSYEVLYQSQNFRNSPVAFASVSNKYLLDIPVQEDSTFQVVYYNAPEKLSVQNSSNLYLVALPDFLLSVGLEQAYIYDGQPEQAQYWRMAAERQLQMLNDQITRESYQGSTLVTYSDSSRISHYY